ncbi:PAS domain-containing protein [Aureococcus anophagefferens]|nr:PAS domain-containing protein [Aureococcus anophagefferens]
MRESNDALDSLFGPYDFLESQLGAPPPLEPPRDQRMSQSPEDRSGQGSSRGGGRAMGSLDVLDTFPDAPRSGTFIPVGAGKPDVSSEGSGSGVPAPKRGRNGPAAAAESSSELQDKADRCRARNREHARQTRRRKKEFVENLQRVDTVARILTLRVSETDQGADDPAFWGELVEPDFELRLPHTPYRSFAPYEATASGRTVSGIEAAIADLCGFTAEEAVGKTLAILQGPDTEKGEVADLVRGCEDGHATSALLTNYTKEGDKFQNFLRVFPLTEDDGTKVSHMLGVLQNVNA